MKLLSSFVSNQAVPVEMITFPQQDKDALFLQSSRPCSPTSVASSSIEEDEIDSIATTKPQRRVHFSNNDDEHDESVVVEDIIPQSAGVAFTREQARAIKWYSPCDYTRFRLALTTEVQCCMNRIASKKSASWPLAWVQAYSMAMDSNDTNDANHIELSMMELAIAQYIQQSQYDDDSSSCYTTIEGLSSYVMREVFAIDVPRHYQRLVQKIKGYNEPPAPCQKRQRGQRLANVFRRRRRQPIQVDATNNKNSDNDDSIASMLHRSNRTNVLFAIYSAQVTAQMVQQQQQQQTQDADLYDDPSSYFFK